MKNSIFLEAVLVIGTMLKSQANLKEKGNIVSTAVPPRVLKT